ncbi:MAG: GNAT family N-acetyltransferase [Pseudolysinimonas sp.]
MIQLRTAISGDAAGLARVHVDSWRETYADYVPESYFGEEVFEARSAMWTNYLALPKPHGTLTVVDRDGRIVGFSFSGPASGPEPELGIDPARTLQLFSIYLLGAEQGAGIGTRLLRAAIGDQPAQLWVATKNTRAIDFYRHHGFATDGTEYVDANIAGLVELRMVR